jgi:hypothetical protein
MSRHVAYVTINEKTIDRSIESFQLYKGSVITFKDGSEYVLGENKEDCYTTLMNTKTYEVKSFRFDVNLRGHIEANAVKYNNDKIFGQGYIIRVSKQKEEEKTVSHSYAVQVGDTLVMMSGKKRTIVSFYNDMGMIKFGSLDKEKYHVPIITDSIQKLVDSYTDSIVEVIKKGDNK